MVDFEYSPVPHSKQLYFDPTSISLSEELRYAPPLLAFDHAAPAARNNAACGRHLLGSIIA